LTGSGSACYNSVAFSQIGEGALFLPNDYGCQKPLN
jgi:hypothetical protein